jgi:5-formyltetrahydrofolate cyclo-ligase
LILLLMLQYKSCPFGSALFLFGGGKVDRSKYSALERHIPGIDKILDKKSLGSAEKKCLKNIYQHYYVKKDCESVPYAKSVLRKTLKEKRAKIDLLNIKKRSLNLARKVINSTEYKRAGLIFSYISFDHEVDTFAILDHCLTSNKGLCVPVITDGKMQISRITGLTGLKKSKFGILEPEKIEPVDNRSIDLAIVPALAYNPLGYRLGYGKGHYDGFLKEFEGVSIGLALKEFIVPDLIPGEFDMPVDKILAG